MDNTESFIADDIVSDVLKIEIENGMKLTFNLKCDVFKTPFLNTYFPQKAIAYFLHKSKSERRNNQAIIHVQQDCLNNVFDLKATILGIFPMMQF